MKKIGIITYHFAINYGAVLQCYALQTYLEKKGFEVEILNYINKTQKKNNGIVKSGKPIKKILVNSLLRPFREKIIEKHNNFNEFTKEYLNLSKEISDVDELSKYINQNDFDYLISGSDQVFNKNIDDFDVAFLFPFKCKAKKISYAASTGNANRNDILCLKKYLDKFDRLSIREEKDLSKFDGVVDKELSVVCDPVMLLEEKKWCEITNKAKKIEEDYAVCYFLHKHLFHEEFKKAKKIAKERKLKLIIINSRFSINSLRKNTIFTAGPNEFVTLLKHAKFVCTDSFHGTLFSVIFNKEFICFDSKQNINDSRRKNLLQNIGGINAYHFTEESLEKNKIELDYKKINNNIKEIINESSEFLECLNERKI
ncbi:MAG: polysaccharide pyruvyl transferase family protein [Clostridium sp.]